MAKESRAKEIRITFKDKELDLFNYLQDKSSASGFLKDLAKFEMRREIAYLENDISRAKEGFEPPASTYTTSVAEYDDINIDISDLGL